MIKPVWLLMLGCLLFSGATQAASKVEIDLYVQEALADLYKQSPAARELASRAKGMLVFPSVYKAGFWVGGEYGEGALRIGGANVRYYNIASASLGLQLGAQKKSQVILFMTDSSLKKFRNSEGWKAGVDGSVAIASFGAGGDIDTNTAQQPIIGFIFSNKGLMYNLTIEGSKITPMAR
ncbi:BPSL1445 family SYLF domain-containing lipoprotein [Porticoccus sp.]